ncbi:MAG TPA: glycosyltransferase [Myxococcota bacterium]|nr:glycosyltransferase [Myxococcota bacterium]
MGETQLVVPCFNEASRLPGDAFRAFCARTPSVDFLFVNDGSTDATLERLRELERELPGRVGVLDLERNGGKAEAVRRGMCTAFKSSAEHVGYWDADLATPLDEIPRFTSLLAARPHVELVMGARVQLLGRRVRRSPVRHYLGRVFATAVSQVLHLPVYDTQCGAKLLRNRPELAVLFEAPFCVNWTFDVELLARFLAAGRGAGALYELPLECWEDVAGSRVRATDFFVAFVEVARIWSRYGGALS